MKKVIRLTESELTRIVKRIIMEQPTQEITTIRSVDCNKLVPNNYKKVVQLFLDATNEFEGWNWDENKISQAFLMVNSMNDLKEINKYLYCFLDSSSHEPGEWPKDTNVVLLIYKTSLDYNVTDFMDSDLKNKIDKHLKLKQISLTHPSLGKL